MHISTRKRIKETELNMTPMIDVVFLLITFFMVVTEITRQDDIADLQLPDVAAATIDDNPDPERLIINIKKTGMVYVSGAEYNLANPADTNRVKNLLWTEARISRSPATGSANRVVLVRADKRTPFKYVRKIMQLCVDRDIGIWRLAFGTLPFQSREAKLEAEGKTRP
ncbi:biopolymer transporter ExbD [bacterium]|nr:biopolymer transporter ExbD [bacterium]